MGELMRSRKELLEQIDLLRCSMTIPEQERFTQIYGDFDKMYLKSEEELIEIESALIGKLKEIHGGHEKG